MVRSKYVRQEGSSRIKRFFQPLALMVWGLALAGSMVTLSDHMTVGPSRYKVSGDSIEARALGPGRVAWTRKAPGPRARWLGHIGEVLLLASRENDVLALASATGKVIWRRQSETAPPRLVGPVVIVTEASGWAFEYTHVLKARTGEAVFTSRGQEAQRNASFLIYQCGALAVPYCAGDRTIVVDRLDLKTLSVDHRELALPELPGCTYADGFVRVKGRYDRQHLDYLIEASCGFVFVRYEWQADQPSRPFTRVLKRAVWPDSK